MITIILSIVIITHLCVGGFVFLRKRKSRTHQIFAAITLGMATWVSGVTFMTVVDNLFWKLWFARTAFAGAMMLPTLFLIFSYFFPRERVMNRYVKGLIIFGCLFFFLFPLTISSITAEGEFVKTFFSARILPVFITTYLLFAGYNFLRGYRGAKQEEKQRLKYFFIGLSISICIGMTTNLFLPILANTARFKEVGPLASVIFVAMTAYAIARFELLKIYVQIKRSKVLAPMYVGILLFITTLVYGAVFLRSMRTVIIPLLIMFYVFLLLNRKYFAGRIEEILPLAEFRLAECLHFHFYRPKKEYVKTFILSAQREMETTHKNIDIAVAFGNEKNFYSFGSKDKRRVEYYLGKILYKNGYSYFDPITEHKKGKEKMIAAFYRMKNIEYMFLFEGEKYARGMVLIGRVKGKIFSEEDKQRLRVMTQNLAANLEGAYEAERLIMRSKIIEYRAQREEMKKS